MENKAWRRACAAVAQGAPFCAQVCVANQPFLGPASLDEYQNVLNRSGLFTSSKLTAQERGEVFDGLLNRCRWAEVFYAWRPNLPDEADNHLMELAVGSRAEAIVTRNLRDLTHGELKSPCFGF